MQSTIVCIDSTYSMLNSHALDFGTDLVLQAFSFAMWSSRGKQRSTSVCQVRAQACHSKHT